MRTRIQEVSDFASGLELQISEIRVENEEVLTKNSGEHDGKEKILEAKLDDLNDRLRLGMASMQAAIGENSANAYQISLEEVSFLFLWVYSCPSYKIKALLSVLCRKAPSYFEALLLFCVIASVLEQSLKRFCGFISVLCHCFKNGLVQRRSEVGQEVHNVSARVVQP